MANPLYQQMMQQQQQQPVMPPQPNIMQQIQQFASMIKGDPRQMVQNLLQSGRMTNEQFQQFSSIANQLTGRGQ